MTTLNADNRWYCARCASWNALAAACTDCGREPRERRAATTPLDPKWFESLRAPAARPPSIAQMRQEQQNTVNEIFDETRCKLQTGELPDLP